MSRVGRFGAGVAIAAAAAIALVGCALIPTLGGGTAPSGPVPTTAEDFYAQTLTWRGCGDGLDCTIVRAPINWDAPADGSINLAVVRHKATSGKPLGSLLVNPGGPGGSGFDFVHDSLSYAVSDNLAANFDVIGWDPRGVGQSTPVVCYTSNADRDEDLYGTFDAPYDTPEWVDELTTEVEAYAAACEKNTGEFLAHVDTVSNVKDMDMMRAVFGDDQLNFLGYSYGTELGATYAELFPDKVGRLVLDGAVDPTLTDFEELKVQMAGFESGFRAYMQFCLANDGCPFTGSLDQALLQVRSVLDGVDALKLKNSDGRVLDSATLATGIVLNLYNENYWQYETDMFVALQDGDPSLAFQSADYYNDRNPDGSYSGNSVDVYRAVRCLDGDFLDDTESTLDRIAEIDAAAPTLGKYMTYDDFAILDTACTHWPVPRVAPPTVYDAVGAAPILVIGTSNDPVTPYAWAQALASQLSSGVLISHTGEGHTAYNQGNACVDDAVDHYFTKGTVPAADPMC